MNSEKLQFHQIHFSAFAWRRHFIFWEFGEREMKIWVFLLEKQRQAKGVQTRKERNYEYSDIYV